MVFTDGNVVLLDDRGVALVLGLMEAGELFLAHRADVGADGLQARAGVGQRQDGVDLVVHAALDRGGRAAGHVDAIPGAHLHAGHAGLGHGGHVGQLRIAGGAQDRQRPHLAALDVRNHRGRGLEGDLHLAAHQVDHGRAAAAIGNVRDLHAGGVLEQLGRDVLGAAGAAAGEVVLARLALEQRDQFLHRARRHLVVDDQDVGHRAHEHHRRQVAVVVIAQLEQVRGDGMGGGHAHHHGVRVAGFGREVGGQRVRGARLVLHHHGLAQPRTQLVGHRARHGVGAAAGADPTSSRSGLTGQLASCARDGPDAARQGARRDRGQQTGLHACLLGGFAPFRVRARRLVLMQPS